MKIFQTKFGLISSRFINCGRNGNVFDEFCRLRKMSKKLLMSTCCNKICRIWKTFNRFLIPRVMPNDFVVNKFGAYHTKTVNVRFLATPKIARAKKFRRNPKQFLNVSLNFVFSYQQLRLFNDWWTRSMSMPKSLSFNSQRSLIKHVSEESAPWTPINELWIACRP